MSAEKFLRKFAKHYARVPDQALAVRRRDDAARRTIEQPQAQSAFQFTESLGDRRLGNIHARRHLAQLAHVFQCHEQLKVARLETGANIRVELRHGGIQPK